MHNQNLLRVRRLGRNALISVLLLMGVATASAHTQQHASDPGNGCAKKTVGPSVHCGMTPTGLFDGQGRFWVVFVSGEYLYLSHSEDEGKSYNPAVKINKEAESIYSDGENRPKLAFGLHGEIYVSWTQKTNGRFTGDIRFSRSLRKGKTFEPVRTINDDGLLTSHRFDSLLVDDKGHIYLAWLDKRDQWAAKEKGKSYTGSAVYYTVSTDQGKSFAGNRKVADNACECCRMSISKSKDSGAALFWRHIFANNVRDHAFAVLGEKGVSRAMQQASHDNWQIEACPHHGPSMTWASNHYHMAWFTNAAEKKGIYYGYYNPGTQKMESERSISEAASASHPFILNHQDRSLLLVWKAFDGEKTIINLTESADHGKTWKANQVIAHSSGASDHPFLLNDKDAVYLVWQTQNEGMRLIPVPLDLKVAEK